MKYIFLTLWNKNSCPDLPPKNWFNHLSMIFLNMIYARTIMIQ